MPHTTRPRTAPRWVVLAIALALGLVTVLPATARAQAPDQAGVVEQAPILSAWIFWNGEIIVLTGPPLDEGTCIGLFTQGFDYEGFLKPPGIVVTPPGGDPVSVVTHTDRVWIHDDGDTTDPFAWLVGTCVQILSGGPAPQPLARGEGHVTYVNDNVRLAAQVTTADGTRTHVTVVGADEGQYPDRIHYGG